MRELPEIFESRDIFREKTDEGGIRHTSAPDFVRLTALLGAGLGKLGLQGKRVAVIGPNSVKWIATYFAVVGGGSVIIPVDPDLPNEEIVGILSMSHADALVYAPQLDETISEIRSALPDIEWFIPMGKCADGQDRCVSFGDVLHMGRGGEREYMEITPDPDAVCTILYTSGTTGSGKGVMLSARNVMTAASGGLAYLQLGKVSMLVLPMHHTYGFAEAVLLYLCAGTTVCISDSPRYFFQNLQLFRPDSLMLVPLYVDMIHRTIWSRARKEGYEEDLKRRLEESRKLLERGENRGRELFPEVYDLLGGRIKLMISGGAPLRAGLAEEFEDFGITFAQGYGITECSPLVAVNPTFAARNATVGPAIPCCEVRLTDVDENGHGELLVRGTNVMQGYYENPEATAEAIQDGWFATGDLAVMDKDGYITITGRKKNLIVLENGKNVMPDEVEEYLQQIPYVNEVIVYSPEETGREKTLFAQIYPDDETRETYDPEAIRKMLERDIAQVNERLPSYKRIANFHVREKPFEKTTKQSIRRFRAIDELRKDS